MVPTVEEALTTPSISPCPRLAGHPRYYMAEARAPIRRGYLCNDSRQDYLKRFADKEGRTY